MPTNPKDYMREYARDYRRGIRRGRPKGAPAVEIITRWIQKSGAEGITKGRLREKARKISAHQFEAILGELLATGRYESFRRPHGWATTIRQKPDAESSPDAR